MKVGKLAHSSFLAEAAASPGSDWGEEEEGGIIDEYSWRSYKEVVEMQALFEEMVREDEEEEENRERRRSEDDGHPRNFYGYL